MGQPPGPLNVLGRERSALVPMSPAERIVPADLARIDLLQGVDLESVMSLLERCAVRNVVSGETVIQAGNVGGILYMVVRGTLRVYLPSDTELCVAQIDAGDTVGELSILNDQPGSANVRAWEDSRLLVIGEDVFWGLVTASHEFALNLLLLLAKRLRTSNSTIAETLRAQRRFEHAAMFDSLTAVHNRRWLDENLPRLVQRHERDGQPMSLLMLDVDHFKKFNDTHGHGAGDRVLAAVVRTAVRGLRPTDLMARFGGEEFVVILPGTAREGAVRAAERLRVGVQEGARVLWNDEALPSVSVSIGVAQLDPGGTPEAILQAADAALYRAKSAGRNRVSVSPVPETPSRPRRPRGEGE